MKPNMAEAQSRRACSLEQHLAPQLARGLQADLSGGFEELRQAPKGRVPGQFKVWSTKEARAAAQEI